MQIGLQINKKNSRPTVVTGATGLIGRWLLAELTARDRPVAAFVRSPETRVAELRDWVDGHGGRGELVEAYAFDLTESDLGLTASGLAQLERADAVFHLAALFGFGLDVALTRQANVVASERLVELSSTNVNLRRFVHISGYRTKGRAWRGLDVDDEAALLALYRAHGAYETSKMEAHERVRRAALKYSVPLTRISPAMVIGDSRTGETTQLTGLAETIEQLWLGKLPALAGTPQTWMPAISVDFLTSLLASLPDDEESVGDHVLVFDDETPTLPRVLEMAATRMGVKAPSLILPAGLLRALPSSISGVDPEALSFISDDRYDPRPLAELCQRLGLERPPIELTLERWIDHLMDTRFGRRGPRQGRNFIAAGTRVFGRGDRETPEVVYLHGVMLNEHSWTPVTDRVAGSHLALDLPGLGRSEPGGGTPREWMTAALAPTRNTPIVVGHSLGCAFALEYAAAHPGRVNELVLVSPFFLQGRPGWMLRQPWLMTRLFRHGGQSRLAAAMGA